MFEPVLADHIIQVGLNAPRAVRQSCLIAALKCQTHARGHVGIRTHRQPKLAIFRKDFLISAKTERGGGSAAYNRPSQSKPSVPPSIDVRGNHLDPNTSLAWDCAR